VVAGGRRVTALGTSFDVRLDTDRVQVVLVEGKVAVGDRVLEPGEQFVATGDAEGVVSKVDVAAMTSWRNGRIVFDETSLADAVAEVNRYRAKPIVVGDATAGGLKISGTYRLSEVNRFPQALAAYYPLVPVERTSGETVLLQRK
jgi:transmembrane sensor